MGSPQRIAVIAVHGVADQKPGESNTAVARLLLSLGTSARGTSAPGRAPSRSRESPSPLSYSAFESQELHIPLVPAVVHDPESALRSGDRVSGWQRWLPASFRHAFDERRGYVAEVRSKRGGATKEADGRKLGMPEEETGKLEHEIMRSQLAGYAGARDGASYITTRLRGTGSRPAPREQEAEPVRAPPNAQRGLYGAAVGVGPEGPLTTRLDVYELFWADISRFGGGIFAFLGALYQLLFHLATLGRQAIDDAGSEHHWSEHWWWLSNLQDCAIRLLVLPIPVLNLILLVASFGTLPARTLDSGASRVVALVGGAALALVIAYSRSRGRAAATPGRWAAVPLLSAVGGGLAVWALADAAHLPLAFMLLIEWWMAGSALILLLMKQYQRVRPGALLVGFALIALAGVALLGASVYWARQQVPALIAVENGSFWTMQVLFLALRLCWIAFAACAVGAFVVGAFLLRTHPRTEVGSYARSRAAIRTGRLAIAASLSVFLLVTNIVWNGLFGYSVKKLEVFHCREALVIPFPAPLRGLVPPPATVRRWLNEDLLETTKQCPGVAGGGLTVIDYVRGLFIVSVTTGLPLTLLLDLIAFGLLLWMALPSVMMEREAPSRSTNGQSERVGRWLSRGVDATAIVTLLIWIGSIAVPFGFGIVDYVASRGPGALPSWLGPGLEATTRATVLMLSVGGAAIAASAATIIAFIVKAGGSALDVLLDVDNYLRTFPVDGTPRARIAERYASLLRFLAADREADQHYDAIVIVAHSLGSLITIDLLRYFRREALGHGGDPALARLGFWWQQEEPRIPIYLFTMGSPLRQLMNRFFPHRYRWVREEPDNGSASLNELAPTRTVPSPARPAPWKVGVAEWRNAYRSGDYVGRSLWVNEWYARTAGAESDGGYPEPLYVTPAVDGAMEMCIGAGAHTHYWDHTAPDIAAQLDRMVREIMATAELS